MNINEFAVNETAELEGIWKPLGGEARVLVARAQNNNYNTKLRNLMIPYQGPTGILNISDEKAQSLLMEALVGTVLLGWEGLSDTDEEGNEFEAPYSEDTALEWLIKYKELRKIIILIAEDFDNYKASIEDEVKDNIKKS